MVEPTPNTRPRSFARVSNSRLRLGSTEGMPLHVVNRVFTYVMDAIGVMAYYDELVSHSVTCIRNAIGNHHPRARSHARTSATFYKLRSDAIPPDLRYG